MAHDILDSGMETDPLLRLDLPNTASPLSIGQLQTTRWSISITLESCLRSLP